MQENEYFTHHPNEPFYPLFNKNHIFPIFSFGLLWHFSFLFLNLWRSRYESFWNQFQFWGSTTFLANKLIFHQKKKTNSLTQKFSCGYQPLTARFMLAYERRVGFLRKEWYFLEILWKPNNILIWMFCFSVYFFKVSCV